MRLEVVDGEHDHRIFSHHRGRGYVRRAEPFSARDAPNPQHVAPIRSQPHAPGAAADLRWANGREGKLEVRRGRRVRLDMAPLLRLAQRLCISSDRRRPSVWRVLAVEDAPWAHPDRRVEGGRKQPLPPQLTPIWGDGVQTQMEPRIERCPAHVERAVGPDRHIAWREREPDRAAGSQRVARGPPEKPLVRVVDTHTQPSGAISNEVGPSHLP